MEKMRARRNLVNVALILSGLLFAVATRAGAQGNVPVTFREGDVVSAKVMNDLLQRLSAVTTSVTSDDLVGSWTVTQIVPYNGQPGAGGCRNTTFLFPSGNCNITGTTDAVDGLSRSRTDVVTISKVGSAYTYSQATVSSFASATENSPESGTMSVLAEMAIFKNASNAFHYYYARKKSATRIVLQDIQAASSSFNMVILDKRDAPPLPPNDLAVTDLGPSALLTWTDQSANETGFKVQRKQSATAEWSTVATTATDTVSYTDSGLVPSTYWYRVLATNSSGDSISSSEVRVVIH